MNFDQGEFTFDANTSEAGFHQWRQELDAKKRAFELRWGVILSQRVRVSLRNFDQPLEGRIELVPPPKNRSNAAPSFRVNQTKFDLAEIESIVQLEDE